MEIPVQLTQLLTLAFSTVFVTAGLKKIAKNIGGLGAVVVSAVVAVVLTVLGYGAGWIPIAVPTCSPDAPILCVQDWLALAIGATALANLLYALVYAKLFAKPDEPVEPMAQAYRGK